MKIKSAKIKGSGPVAGTIAAIVLDKLLDKVVGDGKK